MNAEIAEAFVSHARYRMMEDYLPKVRQCVELLSEDNLWWRPNENSNSVGNILLHLCGNIRQWIIHGIGGVEDRRERAKEFTERGPIPKVELLSKLEETLHEADKVLAHFDSKKILNAKTVQGFDETCLTVIFHVVEHYAQHLGQISYITKMLEDRNLHYFDL